MKTIVFTVALLIQCLSPFCWAQAAPKLPQKAQFIQVTKPVQWNDGMACEVGEIEVVIDYTRTAYVIWNENGKRYEVNRTHAKKVTSDEAAIALLIKRQQLYAAKNQLMAALAQAMQNQNQIRNAQQQLALLKQLQDLVNGGGAANIPLPGAPALQAGNHWIRKVIERGETIQLEDGSIWQISPLSKIDAILWLVTEKIVIVESGNPLYPYKLVNSDGGTSAEAKKISR